jgi:predicted nucleic-acid-binding protein
MADPFVPFILEQLGKYEGLCSSRLFEMVIDAEQVRERVAYKCDRATTAATLHRLIAIDGVHVEDEATTRLALAAFEAGSADFADYFILESARAAAHWLFTRSTNVLASPRALD